MLCHQPTVVWKNPKEMPLFLWNPQNFTSKSDCSKFAIKKSQVQVAATINAVYPKRPLVLASALPSKSVSLAWQRRKHVLPDWTWDDMGKSNCTLLISEGELVFVFVFSGIKCSKKCKKPGNADALSSGSQNHFDLGIPVNLNSSLRPGEHPK